MLPSPTDGKSPAHVTSFSLIDMARPDTLSPGTVRQEVEHQTERSSWDQMLPFARILLWKKRAESINTTNFPGQSAVYLTEAAHIRSKSYTPHAFWPRWEITVVLNQNETGWGEQTHMKQAEKSSQALWEPKSLLTWPDQGCSCGLLVSWHGSYCCHKKEQSEGCFSINGPLVAWRAVTGES